MVVAPTPSVYWGFDDQFNGGAPCTIAGLLLEVGKRTRKKDTKQLFPFSWLVRHDQ